jgi:4-methylaminobutanoate oxidase (formaldehyde-forming)
VTEDWGTLSLMGPRARAVLAACTGDDVSNAAFPFGHVRQIAVAGVMLRALRITYVGELGWELHVPLADTGKVYDALMAAGAAFAIRPVGYRALESLRLEKGYRAWSSDITPNDTPFEAGLGFAVKMRSSTPFLGRNALAAVAGQPLTKRLAGFTIADPEAVLVGRETILRNGQPVGYLTSGGFGYTLQRSIGYGYVRNAQGVSDDFLLSGRYELLVASETYPAEIGLSPFYDPSGERVKA